MIIGDHLRMLREHKKLSQHDIEIRTGLLRCYISRVETNHTTPTVETLAKMAGGLGIPLYQIFYDGLEHSKPPIPTVNAKVDTRDGWGNEGKGALYLQKLRLYLSRMTPSDRDILMTVVSQLVKQKIRRDLKSG